MQSLASFISMAKYVYECRKSSLECKESDQQVPVKNLTADPLAIAIQTHQRQYRGAKINCPVSFAWAGDTFVAFAVNLTDR
jgi:hypothetical protein